MRPPAIAAGADPGRRRQGEKERLEADAAAPRSPPGAFGYFRDLWNGDIALSRVFWRDMVVIGTLINLVAMGLALFAVALGASTATGIGIFLSPVPYNILLVTSVWRRADREPSEWAWPARLGAMVWLVLAFVI